MSESDPQAVPPVIEPATAQALASVAAPSPNASPAPLSKPAAGAAPKSAWSPLAKPLFRALWIATVVSYIGTWAQEAGGPWLMHLLTGDNPRWIANVAIAGSLPLCLFSLMAGVLADILDRRRLLFWLQVWMLVASGSLGVVTLLGYTTPWVLIGFTVVLYTGSALSGPAFQAIVPELVPPADMPLAVSLNSVALNVARAVGPALGMLVVAWATNHDPTADKAAAEARGPGASFLLNALTFIGVAVVLWRWKRPPQRASASGERMWDGMAAGLRYTAHSPALRAILVRVVLFIVPAVALWSQLPVINQQQLSPAPQPAATVQAAAAPAAQPESAKAKASADEGREGAASTRFTFLMVFLGVGAVIGVGTMPKLQALLSIEGMVAASTAGYALGLLALAFTHDAWLADMVMVFIGVNWVIVPTNFNIATQRSSPAWVKGRALAMYMTALWGSWAVGSAVWGSVSGAYGVSTSLTIASGALFAGMLLMRMFPLTRNLGADLKPARVWPAPVAPPNVGLLDGPVQVNIEYEVSALRAQEFVETMHGLRQSRLRDGAASWSLLGDAASPGRFVESFSVSTWGVHLRQHERTTAVDAALELRARAMHIGSAPLAMHYYVVHIPQAGARPSANGREAEAPDGVLASIDQWAVRTSLRGGALMRSAVAAMPDRVGREIAIARWRLATEAERGRLCAGLNGGAD